MQTREIHLEAKTSKEAHHNGQLLSYTQVAEEVRGISRQSAPIHVVVHYPKTVEGTRELARRAADVHADTVSRFIQKLNCPSGQKLQLLDAVIQTAKKGSR